MRSLPWLVKKEDQSDDSHADNPLKRKRNRKPPPQPIKAEPSSASDDTTILDPTLDLPLDVMIPGYDNDDAYIMVENDFLEAAKQVTRHLHLEAYQNRDTAPVEGDIVRPTTGAPKRVYKANVHEGLQVDATSDEEEEEMGKDVTSLGQLLRRRPAALVPATPIKRQVKSQESQPVQSQRDVREKKVEIEVPRPQSRGADADDEEDEDDEDLDRPRKISKSNITQSSRPSSKPATTSSRTSFKRTVSTNKPSTTLDPDWIFSALWGDDDEKRPSKPSSGVKRGKVSLADQLQESSFKMFEKKKAISLKDQFKFMER